MMRALWVSFGLSTVLAVSIFGCNKILDNTPGSLATSDEAGLDPTEEESPGAVGPDMGSDAATSSDTEEPPVECQAGQKSCHGICVPLTDPNYGCGSTDCAACPSSNGTMGCRGGKCVVATCDPGYSDCNTTPGDGCETSLSKPTSCGSCTTTCPADAKFCIPMGATSQCANGCPANAPLVCEGECVNPDLSASHCGGCNKRCPAVANATSTCAGGACGFACRAQFHKCGGTCELDTDPTKCGAACTVCPVPAGGAATCVNGACGVSCPAGSHLCGNRCAANDPTACGAACTACPVPAGGNATCANDACGQSCPAGSQLCGGRCATNDPTACGAGCTVCPVPVGGAATCVNGACGLSCPAGSNLCGGQCVPDNPAACGPGCTVCPVPAGGTATCVNGVCGSGCPAGTNLCGGLCTASDVTSCGAACAPCPAAANATATCVAQVCGLTCSAGFGNCDANAANGCEAVLGSDALNCGACGVSCAGQPCVAGVCQAPPPPPPP